MAEPVPFPLTPGPPLRQQLGGFGQNGPKGVPFSMKTRIGMGHSNEVEVVGLAVISSNLRLPRVLPAPEQFATPLSLLTCTPQ